MAKPKRSVALFEVIHKDKRFDRRGGTLPTPSWWFKGKQTAAGAAPPPPPRPFFTRRIKPAKPVVLAETVPSVSPPPPPVARQPLVGSQAAAPSAAIQANAADSWPVVGSAEGIAPMQVSSRRPPSPWTPASIAIIAASLVVVLALGFGISHRRHRISAAQTALKGPPHPEVLDLGYKPAAANNSPLTPAMATPAADRQPPRRQANLDYVLIHLYVTQHSANQICDLLNKHDIPCTVEHAIPGVAPQLYAVVGTRPFARASSPDYVQYVQEVKAALGSALSAHAFRPQLLKWNPPGDQTAQAK